ncbi:hypothetical protein ACN4EK_26120 [Pantanalinema rosaneae CENA516]|uniref:hypothetical protein n=1 Tax=Pantanalinema rosaneae TaxID=1620701 RepID=UPI003D6F926D
MGKAGSEKYRDWRARIQRREAIAELEPQLSMLQELIDRQLAMTIEIPEIQDW